MVPAMRQLILLRHAKSSWDDPGLPDHARPLNARGRRAAAVMAAVMRDLGLGPDLVLVSSARRTLQTLEALSPLPDSPIVEPMDDLYLATWQRMLDTLRGVDGFVFALIFVAAVGLGPFAGMIGVAVGNNGKIYWPPGINIEFSLRTVNAFIGKCN